jgi:hypothetical protein
MPSRIRVLAVGLLAVVASAGMLATPAHADRCEPTELVLRAIDPTYEEPIDERDSALCYVLLNYGYYYLCVNGAQGLACFLKPNPGVRPLPPLQDYHPEPGRVFCTVSMFVITEAGIDDVGCQWEPIWAD